LILGINANVQHEVLEQVLRNTLLFLVEFLELGNKLISCEVLDTVLQCPVPIIEEIGHSRLYHIQELCIDHQLVVVAKISVPCLTLISHVLLKTAYSFEIASVIEIWLDYAWGQCFASFHSVGVNGWDEIDAGEGE
jgi:hypothetical protein